jgi:hypothetical protein
MGFSILPGGGRVKNFDKGRIDVRVVQDLVGKSSEPTLQYIEPESMDAKSVVIEILLQETLTMFINHNNLCSG